MKWYDVELEIPIYGKTFEIISVDANHIIQNADWQMYDSVALVKKGYHFPEILVDQGDADSFLEEGLRPWLLEDACKNTNINLKLRMQPNYDHSYYFISTFMSDHLIWHRERL